jgi:SAM-dependent methyltransferase
MGWSVPLIGWSIPEYAGGHCYITHIDRGVLEFLGSRKGCGSLLDVGCGVGGQVQQALEMGWGAFGIDVDLGAIGAPNVALIDLAQQPVIFHEKFDVVWSVETAEHIPEKFEENYLQTLVANCGRYLVMTASNIPMQLHVNCKPREHWIKALEKKGMWYDELGYKKILEHSTMEREFLRDTGMFFISKEY